MKHCYKSVRMLFVAFLTSHVQASLASTVSLLKTGEPYSALITHTAVRTRAQISNILSFGVKFGTCHWNPGNYHESHCNGECQKHEITIRENQCGDHACCQTGTSKYCCEPLEGARPPEIGGGGGEIMNKEAETLPSEEGDNYRIIVKLTVQTPEAKTTLDIYLKVRMEDTVSHLKSRLLKSNICKTHGIQSNGQIQLQTHYNHAMNDAQTLGHYNIKPDETIFGHAIDRGGEGEIIEDVPSSNDGNYVSINVKLMVKQDGRNFFPTGLILVHMFPEDRILAMKHMLLKSMSIRHHSISGPSQIELFNIAEMEIMKDMNTVRSYNIEPNSMVLAILHPGKGPGPNGPYDGTGIPVQVLVPGVVGPYGQSVPYPVTTHAWLNIGMTPHDIIQLVEQQLPNGFSLPPKIIRNPILTTVDGKRLPFDADLVGQNLAQPNSQFMLTSDPNAYPRDYEGGLIQSVVPVILIVPNLLGTGCKYALQQMYAKEGRLRKMPLKGVGADVGAVSGTSGRLISKKASLTGSGWDPKIANLMARKRFEEPSSVWKIDYTIKQRVTVNTLKQFVIKSVPKGCILPSSFNQWFLLSPNKFHFPSQVNLIEGWVKPHEVLTFSPNGGMGPVPVPPAASGRYPGGLPHGMFGPMYPGGQLGTGCPVTINLPFMTGPDGRPLNVKINLSPGMTPRTIMNLVQNQLIAMGRRLPARLLLNPYILGPGGIPLPPDADVVGRGLVTLGSQLIIPESLGDPQAPSMQGRYPITVVIRDALGSDGNRVSSDVHTRVWIEPQMTAADIIQQIPDTLRMFKYQINPTLLSQGPYLVNRQNYYVPRGVMLLRDGYIQPSELLYLSSSARNGKMQRPLYPAFDLRPTQGQGAYFPIDITVHQIRGQNQLVNLQHNLRMWLRPGDTPKDLLHELQVMLRGYGYSLPPEYGSPYFITPDNYYLKPNVGILGEGWVEPNGFLVLSPNVGTARLAMHPQFPAFYGDRGSAPQLGLKCISSPGEPSLSGGAFPLRVISDVIRLFTESNPLTVWLQIEMKLLDVIQQVQSAIAIFGYSLPELPPGKSYVLLDSIHRSMLPTIANIIGDGWVQSNSLVILSTEKQIEMSHPPFPQMTNGGDYFPLNLYADKILNATGKPLVHVPNSLPIWITTTMTVKDVAQQTQNFLHTFNLTLDKKHIEAPILLDSGNRHFPNGAELLGAGWLQPYSRVSLSVYSASSMLHKPSFGPFPGFFPGSATSQGGSYPVYVQVTNVIAENQETRKLQMYLPIWLQPGMTDSNVVSYLINLLGLFGYQLPYTVIQRPFLISEKKDNSYTIPSGVDLIGKGWVQPEDFIILSGEPGKHDFNLAHNRSFCGIPGNEYYPIYIVVYFVFSPENERIQLPYPIRTWLKPSMTTNHILQFLRGILIPFGYKLPPDVLKNPYFITSQNRHLPAHRNLFGEGWVRPHGILMLMGTPGKLGELQAPPYPVYGITSGMFPPGMFPSDFPPGGMLTANVAFPIYVNTKFALVLDSRGAPAQIVSPILVYIKPTMKASDIIQLVQNYLLRFKYSLQPPKNGKTYNLLISSNNTYFHLPNGVELLAKGWVNLNRVYYISDKMNVPILDIPQNQPFSPNSQGFFPLRVTVPSVMSENGPIVNRGVLHVWIAQGMTPHDLVQQILNVLKPLKLGLQRGYIYFLRDDGKCLPPQADIIGDGWVLPQNGHLTLANYRGNGIAVTPQYRPEGLFPFPSQPGQNIVRIEVDELTGPNCEFRDHRRVFGVWMMMPPGTTAQTLKRWVINQIPKNCNLPSSFFADNLVVYPRGYALRPGEDITKGWFRPGDTLRFQRKPGSHPPRSPPYPGQYPGQYPGRYPGQYPGQVPRKYPGLYPGKFLPTQSQRPLSIRVKIPGLKRHHGCPYTNVPGNTPREVFLDINVAPGTTLTKLRALIYSMVHNECLPDDFDSWYLLNPSNRYLPSAVDLTKRYLTSGSTYVFSPTQGDGPALRIIGGLTPHGPSGGSFKVTVNVHNLSGDNCEYAESRIVPGAVGGLRPRHFSTEILVYPGMTVDILKTKIDEALPESCRLPDKFMNWFLLNGNRLQFPQAGYLQRNILSPGEILTLQQAKGIGLLPIPTPRNGEGMTWRRMRADFQAAPQEINVSVHGAKSSTDKQSVTHDLKIQLRPEDTTETLKNLVRKQLPKGIDFPTYATMHVQTQEGLEIPNHVQIIGGGYAKNNLQITTQPGKIMSYPQYAVSSGIGTTMPNNYLGHVNPSTPYRGAREALEANNPQQFVPV